MTRPGRPCWRQLTAGAIPVGNEPARRGEGWRGQCACVDAAHRVHARVEDVICPGKDTGLRHFPSHDYGLNKAGLTRR
jgi:hypothetical protein